jgi:opacity protein-like surface antigen
MHRPAAPRLAFLAALAASPALLQSPARAENGAGKTSGERKAPESEARPAAVGDDGPRTPVTLDVYGIAGPSVRVGGAPGFEVTQRTGLLAGAGVVFAPARSFALGFTFEHADLGTEKLGLNQIGSATVDRAMNGLWLDLRVHPLKSDAASIFAGLGVGLAWQYASASRFEDPEGTGRTATLTFCDASDSANVALRAGAGVEINVGAGFFVVGDLWIENARLSGELLGGCVGGAGTSTLFTARAGLAYRIDLSSAFVSR